MRSCKMMLVSLLIVFITDAFAVIPDNAVYISGGDNKNAVILAHGKGKHPRWLVVDPLRKGINERLGYHTLSLQMPTGYRHWQDYQQGFSKAYQTIKEAIVFLQKEKGVSKVFLVGHSMGARMASAFASINSDHTLAGLIVVGCRNNGGRPLACDDNLQGVTLPILDIWGAKSKKDSHFALQRHNLLSSSYTQLAISGANHQFEGYENELIEAVTLWLKAQK